MMFHLPSRLLGMALPCPNLITHLGLGGRGLEPYLPMYNLLLNVSQPRPAPWEVHRYRVTRRTTETTSPRRSSDLGSVET